MQIRKTFSFAGGWTLTAEAEAHTLRLTAAKGDWAMTLSACDTFTLHSLWPQTAAKAYLLGDRIGTEETADCLTLHTSPYDPLQLQTVGAMMAHYRLEKAGENAVRISAWIDNREPAVAESFSWLALKTDKSGVERCACFDPERTWGVAELTHPVRFGSAALERAGKYVLLTDCGEAAWVPNLGTYENVTPLCGLNAVPGQLRMQDIARLDAAHPLTAVLAFGDGAPRLPDLACRAAAAPAALEGERCELHSGRLTAAVYVRPHGVSLAGISLADFAPAGKAGPLVRLQVVRLSDGQVLTLTGEHDWERVRVQAGEKRLSVYLDRPLGIDLSVSVEARAAEGDAIEWRTSVLNQSDAYSVLSASYPGIRFCGAQNASFFKPVGSGSVDADACSRRKRWNGDYPSGFYGTMPVLGVYDPAKKRGSGLYVAIHAPQAEKLFMNAAFLESGEGCFDFDYPAQNLGRPANSFALNGALVLRVLDGDWYDMARIYGDYVHACAEWCPPLGREDSPAWMRDVPMYIMDWMPNDNPAADPVPISVRPAKEPPRDNWYKKPVELARRLGLPIGYHLYNWHFIPFNNDYPYYFPVKEGLDTGVREMHRHGIHVMPYINGRIVDTRDMHSSTERFDREFRAGATKSPDGSLNLERYASHEPDGTLCELAAMCPSEKVWRDTLAEIARRLFEDYDMDAVYIDQVAAARINLCCDPAHGHTPGNGAWWVRSYRLLMERLRRECPEGRGFTTESNAECYADQFDGFLTWAWTDPNLVPFFPKVYAGRIAMLGRNTNGYKKADAQYCRYHIGQAVMFGQQIGWINADVVDAPEKMDYLERMCRMRWDTRDFYSRGEMLRPPVIESGNTAFLSDCSMGHDELTPADTVLAAGWQLEDTVLIALTNTGDAAAEVTVSYDAAEYGFDGTPEAKNYGGCRLLSAEAGCLRASLGPQSCLALTARRN